MTTRTKSTPRATKASARVTAATPADGFVVLNGREMFRISDYDQLPPFLMSIVSDSDHWMYLSSTGGLTAGRVNESGALFPYVTDDKLHQCFPFTGPHTLVRLRRRPDRPPLGTLPRSRPQPRHPPQPL